MRFEEVSLTIAGTASGIYIAYPTTPQLKPTYRGHKTLVNDQHTKVGVATKDFVSREDEYMRTFQSDVAFYPVLACDPSILPALEARILHAMRSRYPLSGTAREWFRTTDRQAVADLIWELAGAA